MTTTDNPVEAALPTHRPPSNLVQRLATSVVLLPLVMAATFAGGWLFVIMAATIALVGLLEFYSLARGRHVTVPVLPGLILCTSIMLAFFTAQPMLALFGGVVALSLLALLLAGQRHGGISWRKTGHTALMALGGVAYLGIPVSFLIALRGWPDGLLWVFVVYAITWGNDTFAYIGGRLWGKRPLAPAISPKKTVEGAIVGWAAGTVSALIMFALNDRVTPAAVILCCIGPGVAILGDLVESGMKRFFHVKDSRMPGLDIFPGHGGVLDRTDSLVLVVTLCYLYATILM